MRNRLISLLLAAVMLLSLAACSGTPETTDPTGDTQSAGGDTQPAETTQPVEETPTLPNYEEVANPVTFFSLSLGENYENVHSITAYANEDGTVHVEYVGAEKKVGDFDASLFHGITAALETSGLVALHGQDAYGEGEANGSMYIDFADGTYAAVGYAGDIPQAYTDGYNAMDAYFQEIVAQLPAYVPQPMVFGEVDQTLLATMLAILNGNGIEGLDTFTITQVAKDEYFAYTLGLSSDEGITSAASCAPMMMTTAFSLVVVSLEEGKDAAQVCSDFEQNIDWRKWVCVAPSNAMIAQKDNMVLCLIGADTLYAQCSAGVEGAGWTVVKTLTNPDLQ